MTSFNISLNHGDIVGFSWHFPYTFKKDTSNAIKSIVSLMSKYMQV